MNDLPAQHGDLTEEDADDEVRARREFLKKCGKYAVVVPPAMAFLMTRQSQPAMASTGTGTGVSDWTGTGDSAGSGWWKNFWGGWF